MLFYTKCKTYRGSGEYDFKRVLNETIPQSISKIIQRSLMFIPKTNNQKNHLKYTQINYNLIN